MATRRYSNTARQTFLSVGVTAVDPPNGGTINIDDTTGWVTPGAGEEALAALDFENQSKVELVTYTGKTASTLTGVKRGVDGTTAQQHSAGAVVRHVASALDFEGGPWARVYRSTQQTIPHITITAISFDTKVFDSGGLWVVGSPSRLTVPAGYGGQWLVVGQASFVGSASGASRTADINKNGIRKSRIRTPATIAGFYGIVGGIIDAVAGDYFELAVLHDTGSDLLTESGDANLSLAAAFLGV